MKTNKELLNTRTYRVLEQMGAVNVIDDIGRCMDGKGIRIEVDEITRLENEAADKGREIQVCSMRAESKEELENKIAANKDGFDGRKSLMIVSGDVSLSDVAYVADKVSVFSSELFFGAVFDKDMRDISLSMVTY